MSDCYRIGLLGTDNSHADAFCNVFNLQEHPNYIGGAKIVSVFGRDEGRTKEVAEKGRIPEIVSSPEEMLGKVDAVAAVFRNGDLHMPYCLPFIEAGIPAFVDKPFCNKVADCKVLIEAAEKAQVPITSASSLRYSSVTRGLIEEISEIGDVVAGQVTGPADIESQYGGLPFYGVHVAELLQEVFGRGVKTIKATERSGDVIALAMYEDKMVTLNLLKRAKYVFSITAYGSDGWATKQIENADGYQVMMKEFLRMLDEKKPVREYSEMLESVRILEAVEESFRAGGREVTV